MNSARFSRFALYGLAGVILIVAILIWSDRTARARQPRTVQTTTAAPQQQHEQRALELLERALQAEHNLTYAARTHTMAAYGDEKVKSIALLVQAPGQMSIKYVDGQYKGMQCGYSERWFYRQCYATKRMVPYAEVGQNPEQTAARHFALLLQNYQAHWVKSEQVENRPVEVVQIVPAHEIEGARGPAQRLWIDAETGLPLRTEYFDHQLRPVLDTSLSELDLKPVITPATFTPSNKIRDMANREPWVTRDMGKNPQAVVEMIGLLPPAPEYLPPGFVADYVGVHLLNALTKEHTSQPKPEDYTALARYTDGLNMMTVFALRRAAHKNGGEIGENYEFGPGTLVMREVSDGYMVAVADLPGPILRRVLDSAPEQILR